MKVLISDDDPTLRLLMGTLLRTKLHYEVFETSDGLKAWQALESGMVVDLCILDMWMPGLSGVELLAKIRANPRYKRQKVILCSAENGQDSILKAVALGVSGYLIKPFVAQSFLDYVRKTCQSTQTGPLRGPLEPVETALERLGIERKAYLDMLAVFSKDVGSLIAELRKPAGNGNKVEMARHLGGVRGAGRCLGADDLVAAILHLEETDPAGKPQSLLPCIDALEKEHKRLIAAMEVIARQIEPPKAPAQEQKSEPVATASPEPAKPQSGDPESPPPQSTMVDPDAPAQTK